LELDEPLTLADGTQVEVEIYLADAVQAAEAHAWASLRMSRLEEEWENPEDAIYDDWKTLYGV
jgi:hypothetical protein